MDLDILTFENQCHQLNHILNIKNLFLRVFELKKNFVNFLSKTQIKNVIREFSGCITEKHNRFHIVRLEFAKKLSQKFLPIDINYKPVSKYTKIINCYFSTKLNLAFRSTFNENSKIRHNTAFQCYYCLNWYGRKDKFDQHLNCYVGKLGYVYNFNPNLGGRGNFTLQLVFP